MAKILEVFTEDALHAYVDDRLDPLSRRAVERLIDNDDRAATRVRAYNRQAALLRQSLDDAVHRRDAKTMELAERLARALADKGNSSTHD